MQTGQQQINEKIEAGQQQLNEKIETINKQIEIGQQQLKENIREVEEKLMESICEVDNRLKEEFDSKMSRVCEEVQVLRSMVCDARVPANVMSTEGAQHVDQPPMQVRDQTTFSGCEPSSRVKVKPPCYDGQTPWSNYLKQFEAAAAANGWSTLDKATALIVGLRGEAINILQTISEEQQRDYGYLVSQLDMRYGNKHLKQVHQVELRNKQQKPKETLQEYEADIARLVRLAYPDGPESFLEQWAVDVFISGLRDIENQQAMRLSRPKTLNEALAYALEFETARQASRSHGRVRSVNEEVIEEPIDEKIQRIVRDMLPKSRLRCWNCGEIGHRRSQCQKPKPEEQLNHSKQEN
jgi:hypothetical protein